MPKWRKRFTPLLAVVLGLSAFYCPAQSIDADNICKQVSEDGSLSVKPKSGIALEAVCECFDVLHLRLRKYPINFLPPCFSKLQNLRSLDLSKTYLVRFPQEIFEMYDLEVLSLAFTEIGYLPEDLWRLTHLKKLDLRGTSIKVLPEGLEYIEMIDFRLCELNREEQDFIRAQYPNIQIYFSSPCHC